MNLQTFYQIRGNLYKLAKRYETIIHSAIKFLGFLIIFRIISSYSLFTGTGPLNSFWLQLVLAVISTVLPNRCGVLIAILLGGYNLISVSLLGGVLLTLFLLILYIITVRFTPEYSHLILLIPLCIQSGFYLLIPLLAGLYVGTVSIIPIVMGTMTWGVVRIIPAFLALQNGEITLDQLPQFITSASSYGYEQLLKNNELIFVAATLAITMLIVNLMLKLQRDYIQYLALGVAGGVGLLCLLLCKMTAELSAGYLPVIFCSILSVAIAAAVQFVWVPLDYKAAQNLSFSDDEYFYQVRVVPKIKIGKEKREIKKITDDKEGEQPGEINTDTRVNWQRAAEMKEREKENTARLQDDTFFFNRDE